MKQTAIEWLRIRMATSSPKEMVENINVWFERALEMEKQQIMGAWHNGKINEQDFFCDHTETIVRANCAEQYYNETYKK